MRVRRYRQRWLIGVSLFAAAAIEAGSAASYQALRPIPPPPPWTLRVDVGGEGDGMIAVTVVGDSQPIQRCTTEQGTCYVEVPRERWISLTAVRGDKMTFEGWGGCAPYADDVLACDMMMFQDREVAAVFGKVPEQIDVAWIETPVSDVDLPTPRVPERPELIEPEQLDEAPIELAMVAPEDVPEVPPPTPPKPEAPQAAESPPVAVVQPPPNLRMVEVPDENEVDEAPDDATHLSDKNRDVREETVATDTNLEKEMTGEQPPSVESDDTTSPEIGGPEDRIAQLEHAESEWNELDRTSDHSGESDEASGEVVGEHGDDGEDGTGGDRAPGILAMRDIGGRGSLVDEHKRGDGKKSGRKGTPGLTRQLDLDDYERIVGKDAAEEERRLARAKMSNRKGRWERKIEAIKSSLENFAPDVRPGNQTALKTRASPFAVYIARMHRRIHELWGFGFLDDLDGKSSGNPLNDWNLMTQLEIAINPDGTVYKTTIAHTSGRLEFDVAAIDVVLSAAPYESPPEAIRSVDGRVYMRWGFYRNWRQCGTFNVEPYILTDIPGGVQPLDDSALADGARARRKRTGRGDKPVTPAPTGDAGPKPGPAITDRAVSYAANMWVAGFTSVSPKRMIRVSALPFYAGGRVAAATQKDLEDLYEGLLVESGSFKDFRVVSPSEFTRRTGIPTDLDDNSMVLLVWATKARFGVALTRTRSGEFRATRILR